MTNIKEVNAETEVTFTCGMNIQGARRKETFTLGDLGWTDEQGEKLQKAISGWFEDWLYNELDSGWFFNEEEER